LSVLNVHPDCVPKPTPAPKQVAASNTNLFSAFDLSIVDLRLDRLDPARPSVWTDGNHRADDDLRRFENDGVASSVYFDPLLKLARIIRK